MRSLKMLSPLVLLLALLAAVSLACSLPELLDRSSPSTSNSSADTDTDADEADPEDNDAADDDAADDADNDLDIGDEEEADLAVDTSSGIPVNEQVNTLFPLSADAIITESGLVIDDLVLGEGRSASAGDTLRVLYTGYLENGAVFDSNVATNLPFEFVLGAGYVIPGWDEGILGMREGGTRLLIIPPELAYGSTGAGDVIPPDETLTFSVRLIEIR